MAKRIDEMRKDYLKLDDVLEESERILEDIHRRLDRINARQNYIKNTDKELEGSLILKEWKESEKGVI